LPETAIDNANNVIPSMFWKLMERGLTQGIQFIISLVLARLLMPRDYGIITIINIIIAITNIVIQNGFGTALIQKRNADNVDFSSVFYLSIIFAILLYAVLFFLSPLVASFYNEPELVALIRTISVIVIFGAINNIQSAFVSRTMQFKHFFFSSMFGVLGSAIVGLVMAFKGYGVWALVAQQVVSNVVVTVVLWFCVKWRPIAAFSLNRVVKLFSFGWKMLCSSLIDTIYVNVFWLVIGKVFGSKMLGFYNRGYQFPSAFTGIIDGSVQSVMLPTLSAKQENKYDVKKMLRRSMMIDSFVLMPLVFGMAAIADSMVQVLLTEKWIFCVPFLQLSCFSYILYPMYTTNISAISAIGKSDLVLRFEIIKKVLGLAILVISVKYGVYVMAIAQIAYSFLAAVINAYPNKKLLDYGVREQLRDLFPTFLLAAFMGVVIYSMHFLRINTCLILVFQISSGLFLYLGGAYLLNFDSLFYLVKVFSELRKKKGPQIKTKSIP
jgi:teichuronic acid exporter